MRPVVAEPFDETLNDLIRQAPVAMARADIEGRIAFSNSHYWALLGRDEASITGRHFSDFSVAKDQAAEREKERELAEHDIGFSIDRRYSRPDGSTVDGRAYVAAIHAPDGSRIGMVCIIAEITASNSKARSAPALAAQVSLRRLSFRQREVLDLLMLGLRTKQIAAVLKINTRTVEAHRAGLMKRTHTKSLMQLAVLMEQAAGVPPANVPTGEVASGVSGAESIRNGFTVE